MRKGNEPFLGPDSKSRSCAAASDSLDVKCLEGTGVLGVRTEAGTSRLWPVRLPPRPDRSLAAAAKEIIARLRKPWRPAGPAKKRRAGRPARPEAEVFVSVSLQASPLPPKALSPPPPPPHARPASAAPASSPCPAVCSLRQLPAAPAGAPLWHVAPLRGTVLGKCALLATETA